MELGWYWLWQWFGAVRHQAITRTNINWSKQMPCGIPWQAMTQGMLKIFITQMCLNIPHLELQPYLAGISELMSSITISSATDVRWPLTEVTRSSCWQLDHHCRYWRLSNCQPLTLKQLGNNFQNVFLFSNIVLHKCNISVWNWPNTMDIKSALLILMTWCFSTRASVAIVLITHPCVSGC